MRNYLHYITWTLGMMLQVFSQAKDCPRSCTCKDLPFQGFVTNCSNLGEPQLLKALPHIDPKTQFLYLEGNNISTIPEGLVINLYTLHSLFLENNAAFDIPTFLSGFNSHIKEQLYTLDLSNNGIKMLSPESFQEFTELQSLLIANNHLDALESGAFVYLRNLFTLDLSHNRLASLSAGVFDNLKQLRDLRLSGNLITKIESGVFSQLSNLQQLNLSDNHLAGSLRTDTFQGLANLQMMELAENKLVDIPYDTFSSTPNLIQLKLEYNKFRKIPIEALQALAGLQYLFLDYNVIEEVPVELNLLSNVTSLYLNNNKIKIIHKHALAGLFKLHSLWLSYNEIQSLPQQLLLQFQHMNLGEVRLEGNPFQCDCDLLWLGRWLRGQHTPYYVQTMPRCHEPQALRGMAVSQTPLEHVICEYEPIVCLDRGRMSSECALLRLNLCLQGNKITRHSCLCSDEAIGPSCKVCPERSYGNISINANAKCKSCPPFSVSHIGSRDISDCHCQEGYTGSPAKGWPCKACPRGTYKASIGAEVCRPCSSGSFSRTEASPVCNCLPGYTVSDGEKHCSPCPPNTYKSETGAGPCKRCPRFSRSPLAANSSRLCTCVHGIFLHNSDNGRCLEFPNQEEIAMGLMPQYKASEVLGTTMSTRYTLKLVLGVLLGSVLVVFVTVATFLHIRQLRQRHTTKEDTQTCISGESPLHRVHQMTSDYVYNQLYEQYEFPRRKLQIGRLLGQGAFGQVHHALAHGLDDSSGPREVAVKSLKDNNSPECRDALRRELEQMIYVGSHPNVISLLGTCTQKGELMIIMEYAPYGNLLDYLKDRKPPDGIISSNDCNIRGQGKRCYHRGGKIRTRSILEDKQLVQFALQIARGMDHLAKMKCVHRDLAARNVLLSDVMVAKVSDFGLAREVYESGYYFKDSKGRLPFRWMSPEALLCGHYTTKSDVWSYGILLWEMVTNGGTPYPGIPAENMYDMLSAGYRMKRPRRCPSKIYEMMLHCWHESPPDRPTFRFLVDKWEKILEEIIKKDTLHYDGSDNNPSSLSSSSWQESENRTLLTYDRSCEISPHITSSRQDSFRQDSSRHDTSISNTYSNLCSPELHIQEIRQDMHRARERFLSQGTSHSSDDRSDEGRNRKRNSRKERLLQSQRQVDEWLNKQTIVICTDIANTNEIELRDLNCNTTVSTDLNEEQEEMECLLAS